MPASHRTRSGVHRPETHRRDVGHRAERAQRVDQVGAGFVRAIGTDDDQWQPRRPRDDVPQHRQARDVGPLQVVEREDHRTLGAAAGDEPGHDVEQPRTLLAGVEPVRREGVVDEVGHQPGQRSATATQLGAQPGRADRLDVAGHGLRERVERAVPVALQAPPREDERAALPRDLGDVAQQRRLPDPRLADDDHDPTRSGGSGRDVVAQRAQLPVPPAQRRRTASDRERGVRRSERRVLGQHALVELPCLRTGLDAEIVAQVVAQAREHLQRLCVATLTAQRQHHLGPATLAQRVLVEHPGELVEGGAEAVPSDLRVDEILSGGLVQLVQAATLLAGEVLVRELREGASPPQPERGAQQSRCRSRIVCCAHSGFRDPAVGDVRIERARSDDEPVAGRLGPDPDPARRLQGRAQPQDVVLQRLDRGPGAFSPHSAASNRSRVTGRSQSIARAARRHRSFADPRGTAPAAPTSSTGPRIRSWRPVGTATVCRRPHADSNRCSTAHTGRYKRAFGALPP